MSLSMSLLTQLEVGQTYLIYHGGRVCRAKFIRERESGFKRKMTHYIFQKESTGREVELKSKFKIRGLA